MRNASKNKEKIALVDDWLVRTWSKLHTKTGCGDRWVENMCRLESMCKIMDDYKEIGIPRYTIFDDYHCQI